MAGFKTHLASGMIMGGGLATMGVLSFGLSLIQAFSVFVMGTLGAILPDLDSESGEPVAIISNTISILFPVLLLNNSISLKSFSPEILVACFVGCYLVMNFLVCELLKRMTVHRGIMHSIPFSILAGEAGYLIFFYSGSDIAIIVGISVFIGCMVHLLLDELNSITLRFGFIPHLKKSAGTALKFRSSSVMASIFVYILLIGATVAIVLAQKVS